MKRWKKALLMSVIEIVPILVLHAWMIRLMAEKNIVSTIFAAGRHVPLLTLATAGLFLLVRFFAVLYLPGMILSRIGLAIMDYYSDARKDVRRIAD
jgi:hypothetical protein